MNLPAADNTKRGAAAPIDDDAPTMPLMGVMKADALPDAADLDVTAVKSPNRMLNQGTMIVIAAFVVGAGSIYAMRIAQAGTSGGVASEVEQKIEQTLIQLSNRQLISPESGVHGDHIAWVRDGGQAILKLLQDDGVEKQVPIEFVKKNPFRLAVVAKATLPDEPVVAVDTAAIQRIRKAREEFAKLRLQTVMKGRPNAAVINDEIYREGQKIGLLTVTRIDPLSVTLSVEGQDFVLKMNRGS